jgi:hypothetical protein
MVMLEINSQAYILFKLGTFPQTCCIHSGDWWDDGSRDKLSFRIQGLVGLDLGTDWLTVLNDAVTAWLIWHQLRWEDHEWIWKEPFII